jgi:hypothetical protein
MNITPDWATVYIGVGGLILGAVTAFLQWQGNNRKDKPPPSKEVRVKRKPRR